VNDNRSDQLRSLKIERSSADDSGDSEGGGLPRWVMPAALVVGALFIGGLGAWFLKPAPPPPPAPVESASTPPSSSSGGSTSSGSLVASGYVVARREATVASETTGRLTEVRVEEGQHVRRGEVIAVLSPTLARAQYASSVARAAAADANVAEARRDLDRTRALSQQGFASDAAMTSSQAAYDAALANRNAAHADAASYNAQLEYFQIRAPFDGIVVDKAAQVGEMISPLSAGGGFTRTGICTIVDMTSLEIEVDVSEAYIARVHENQRVEATLDAYPDQTFPAHVIATIPSADRSRATVRVRIGFDHLDPRILPEMAISVRFLMDDAAAAH
jgi:RND family efflux transporter MFP subunit